MHYEVNDTSEINMSISLRKRTILGNEVFHVPNHRDRVAGKNFQRSDLSHIQPERKELAELEFKNRDTADIAAATRLSTCLVLALNHPDKRDCPKINTYPIGYTSVQDKFCFSQRRMDEDLLS